MPVYRNDDPKQGRYVISPDGRLVYHEECQKTKVGWREAELEDIAAAPREQRIKCGYERVEPPADVREAPSLPFTVKVSATGTIE